MEIEFFEKILQQLQGDTPIIALHVLGDPLVVSDLFKYLDLVQKYKFKAMITTTGYHLQKNHFTTLSHECIKQVNFSLNSFNKNAMDKTFEQYMQPLLEFCTYKVNNNINSFINLRLWNQDDKNTEQQFNSEVFSVLNHYFGTDIHFDEVQCNNTKSTRLDNKVLLNFDNYFIWPALSNTTVSNGYCQGGSKQLAILSDGRVVPCCLDCDGVIELGNLHAQTLKEVLQNKRAKDLIEGFKNSIAVELLCQKCSYKDRFNA